MANNSIMEQIGHDTFEAAILVHRSPGLTISLLNPLCFLWSTSSPWPQASPPFPLTLHSKPNPYPWLNICFVFIVICELSLSPSLKCWKFVCVDGSVFWERERGVFDLFWVLFLIKKCVRVTFEKEVGYGVVTEGSTSG